MTFYIANDSAIAACDAVVDLVDAGTAAGWLRIYDGTVPADADTAITTQNILAELQMSDPAFGAAVQSGNNAVATANSISADTSANNTGTATFFRIMDSAGNVVMQGTVGTSGADLNLNSVAIQAGAEVSVTSFTYTHPES